MELGLETLVQPRAQEKARELRGKITWEGDLNDEREYKWVKKTLDAFTHMDLCDYVLAVKATEIYRVLRARGITIPKTIDTLIATRCIEDGLSLLHADRDFLPFTEHLGLRSAYSEAQRYSNRARRWRLDRRYLLASPSSSPSGSVSARSSPASLSSTSASVSSSVWPAKRMG